MGFSKLKSDARIFGNVKASIYIMAYMDDLIVVGNPNTAKTFLEQFKLSLELKHHPIDIGHPTRVPRQNT
eukprot:5824292-Amphidinium_carterae.3